jgi:hypothetical protein
VRRLAALVGALALAACASEAPEPAPRDDSAAVSTAPSAAPSRSDLPDACARDAKAQVACLIAAFALDQCDDATALSSMFKDNAAQQSYEHRTVYGIGAACLAELEDKARLRGLVANERGEFAGEIESGYSESLIIAMQTSQDGTVIEWGRTRS